MPQKHLAKCNTPIYIKTPGKLKIKGNFLKLVKSIYKNLQLTLY